LLQFQTGEAEKVSCGSSVGDDLTKDMGGGSRSNKFEALSLVPDRSVDGLVTRFVSTSLK